MRAPQSTRGRKSLPPAEPAATRWAVWALRLMARRGRFADAPGLELRHRIAPLRAALNIYHRRLSFYTGLYPRIELAFGSPDIWRPAPANVYAPQLIFLQKLLGPHARPTAKEHAGDTPPASIPAALMTDPLKPMRTHRLAADVRRARLTLAIARTRTEQVSDFHSRHFSAQRETVLRELSERLTRRSRRVDESEVVRTEMALRKDASATPASTRVHRDAWPDESHAFERRGMSHARPAQMMPELNVEQLADQVMKHIDRRVIARRERMGQI